MKKGEIIKKSGISLIVLVITIIVIIVLSVAIILNIANNNPIDNAKKAVTAWNKREDLEQLNLCLAQYLAKKDNITLANFIKENFELQKSVDEVENVVVVSTEKYGYIIEKNTLKVLVQSERDIVEDLLAVKKEYIAYETTALEEEVTTLVMPYNDKKKYPENDSALVEKLPSYNKDKYRLSLQRGHLVCLYDLSVMTEEKIKVCEAFDIYLVGDTNGDHVIDYEDRKHLAIGRSNPNNERRREIITGDFNADGIINTTETVLINIVIRDIVCEEIDKLNEEFKLSRTNKENIGIALENMNASTFEEVKEYIPSYNKNLGYEFKIQKGALLLVYNENLNSKFVIDSRILLSGDVNGDGTLDQEDIEEMQYYMDNPSELEALDLSNDERQMFDLNADGVIDSQDLEMLKSLINS